jgi:predicted lipid-binding transport protein (Tim44 family)
MISLAHEFQTCRRRYVPGPLSGAVLALLSAAALLVLIEGCSYVSMPMLRSRASDAPSASAAPASGADSTAAECAQLRAEIRSDQQAVREAPTTSTSPQIVAAAEAKADKRIDDKRARLDELDCPAEDDGSGVKVRPLAPMPPAPGAVSP